MATQLAQATEAATPAAGLFATRRPRTLWSDAWRQFRRHRLAMFGLIVFVLLVLACAFGPFIYTKPVNDINFAERNQGFSLQHPLGTNDRGEDTLARVLHGGRVSLAVGVVAMLIAITVGTAIGALAG